MRDNGRSQETPWHRAPGFGQLNSAMPPLQRCCSFFPRSGPRSRLLRRQATDAPGRRGPGGGYDLQARIAARHLGRHIPGHPSIIVQNIPSRIAAANMMYSTAMKDGTTIALLQRGILLAKLIYPSGVRFEIDKFHWLGSLNTETSVTLAWNTAPHKTANDLFDKELIVGGITGVDPETTPRLYNSLIGTQFKVVTGYNSTAQIALAIERGEVQGIGDWSWSSLKAVRPQWLAEKKITLLMQGALKNEPELGSLPNALQFIRNDAIRKVMELHFTQKTAARPLVAPPEVPADRVALLRKAFESLEHFPNCRNRKGFPCGANHNSS